MLPNIGFGELVLILAIVLIVFGAKRLPEIAKSIGKSLNAFKRGVKDVTDDIEKSAESDSKDSSKNS